VILSPGPDLVVAAEALLVPSSTAPVSVTTQHGAPDSLAAPLTLEQAERNHIVSILKQTDWRIDGPQGAARLLNLHPSTLRSRIKKLDIRRSAAESS